MEFKTFFSEQARKPSGLFGRMIMSLIFDHGNTVVNTLMRDALEIQKDDRILEIGFGTGKFLRETAQLLDTGCIEGIDFSSTMVEMARRRNRKFIEEGRASIRQADFETEEYTDACFDTVCSANTVYFWPRPDDVVKKIYRILRPGGRVVLTFEDIDQLKERSLDAGIFNLYSTRDMEDVLKRNGFSGGVDIITAERKSQKFHCATAIKKA